MCEMNGSLCVEKCSAGFLNEYAASVGEFHYPTLFPDKKMKPMMIFKFGDLFAKRRLADAQYLGCSREVQLFSQNDYGV